MVTTRRKLLIYTRVSTLKQAEDSDGIKEQAEAGKRLAAEKNLDYEIFEEIGQTASLPTLTNRPQLLRLLDAIKSGESNLVYSLDFTRLSRNDETQYYIQNVFKKNGVELFTANGKYDLSTPQNEAFYSILNIFAKLDGQSRLLRFANGARAANANGKFLKPIPPYGFDKDENGFLVINNEEKDIILKIIEMYESRLGANRIAAWLNKHNIPTKTSKIYQNGYTLSKGKANRRQTVYKASNSWNPDVITSMLKNSVLYGERKYKIFETQFGSVECPAIITKKRFEEIQEIRKKNAITLRKTDKYFFLLKGLLTCAHCGGNLHSRVKVKKGEVTYKCSSKRFAGSTCPSRAISIAKLDALVWDTYKCSMWYNEEIVQLMLKQTDDNEILTAELKRLSIQIEGLVNTETSLSERKKKLFSKYVNETSDTADNVLEEFIDEVNIEISRIRDEIGILNTRAKSIEKQIQKNSTIVSDYEKLMQNYENALGLVSSVEAPFMTFEQQQQARTAINKAIRRVMVKYIPETREHRIQVEFHDMDVTVQIVDNNSDPDDDPDGCSSHKDTYSLSSTFLIPLIAKHKVGVAEIQLPPLSYGDVAYRMMRGAERASWNQCCIGRHLSRYGMYFGGF